MSLSTTETTIEEIQVMIHELARGNFSYRLNKTSGKFAEIGIMLNLLADELSTFFVHPNSFGEKDLPDPSVFVLDKHFKICGFNQRFSSMVGQSKAVLLGTSIRDYISDSSFENFRKQLSQYSENQALGSFRLLLTFGDKSLYHGESWGYCHKLSGSNDPYYFIRITKLIEKEEPHRLLPTPSRQNTAPSILQLRSDIEKIREVHQYILSHLHEPLPSLSIISRRFLVNEYKLKKGFKELYHTTIFRLHLEKRLAQALVMIKNTPTSLKVIAYSLGFKSLPHFSKVFKKKYGHPPSYFRKFR